MRPRRADRRNRRGQDGGGGGEDQHGERQAENGQNRHLHFLGLDLLAEIFRRAPHHQARHEDGDDDEHENAVKTRTDTANDHFAKLHVDERNEAAERREAAMHGVDRAAGRRRGDDRKERRECHAEAGFLAFHVAASETKAVHQRISGRFRPIGNRDAGDEQNAHGSEDRPALTGVADHTAKNVGKGRADCEDRHHLDHVGNGVRVLERMRGIGVEETTAIGAEHLDRQLRRHGADRNRLPRPFQGLREDVTTQCLRHAEPDVNEGEYDADGQKHIERRTDHIHPEIADGLAGSACEGADKPDGNRHARRSGHKVLYGEASHLGEIGHGAFAAIVLPVGIGDEADCRVEGEFRPDCRHSFRIIWQSGLKTHQDIKQDKTEKVEEEHGKRIGRPVLFFAPTRPGKGIKAALDGCENRRKQGAFATKDTRHIEAERLHQRDNDPAEKQDLKPSIEGHGIELSIKHRTEKCHAVFGKSDARTERESGGSDSIFSPPLERPLPDQKRSGRMRA